MKALFLIAISLGMILFPIAKLGFQKPVLPGICYKAILGDYISDHLDSEKYTRLNAIDGQALKHFDY